MYLGVLHYCQSLLSLPLFLQYLPCNSAAAYDPGLRYDYPDYYYMPPPRHINRLNYYLDRLGQRTEEGDAGAGGEKPDQFRRPARSGNEVLRDPLFNSWMKKARGSIRRKSI